MLASTNDIQAWLREDKLAVNVTNSQKPGIEAQRIIKGALAGMFAPVVIASWDGPANTPELIRGVAGRLTASFIYSTIYSEESSDGTSAYAQWLYDGAIATIAQILAGTLTVIDEDGEPIDSEGSGLLSFFPDDTTTPEFTMDKFFA